MCSTKKGTWLALVGNPIPQDPVPLPSRFSFDWFIDDSFSQHPSGEQKMSQISFPFIRSGYIAGNDSSRINFRSSRHRRTCILSRSPLLTRRQGYINLRHDAGLRTFVQKFPFLKKKTVPFENKRAVDNVRPQLQLRLPTQTTRQRRQTAGQWEREQCRLRRNQRL